MKPKQFKELLLNMPDSIKVLGDDKNGTFIFDSEIEFDAGNCFITMDAQGHQDMKYFSGEDEVGLADDWEINRNKLAVIDEIKKFEIYFEGEIIKLPSNQKRRLIKNIEELIYLEI